MTIRTKLVLAFLVFASIPMIAMGIISFADARGSLKDARIAELESTADLKAAEVQEFLSELEVNLQVAQDYFNIKTNLPIVSTLFGDRTNPVYVEAEAMLDGQLDTFRTSHGWIDLVLVSQLNQIVYTNNSDNRHLIGNRLPERAFFEGKTGIHLGEIHERTDSPGQFAMWATAPVTNFNGEFSGVVGFHVDLGPIFSLIQDTAGLGETGETLIAKTGIGPESKKIALFLNPLRHDPNAALTRFVFFGDENAVPIQESLLGRSGSGESVDYRGEEVIAAWRPINATGWGIVAKIDSSEAFKPIGRLRNLSLLVGGVVLLFSAVLTAALSKTIVGPLWTLEEGTRMIGAGDLSHRVGTKAKDEIGELSRSFDQMAINLQQVTASRDDLDQEVKFRTQMEEETRALLDAHPDFIFRMTLAGEFLYIKVSESFDIYGGNSNIVGTNIKDVLPEKLAIQMIACGADALRSGRTQSLEYRLEIGGELRSREGRFTRVGTDEVMAVIRDVTDRTRDFEALQSSEFESARLALINGVIAEIGQIFSSSLNLEDVWGQFSVAARKLLKFDRNGIMSIDLEAGLVFREHIDGPSIPNMEGGTSYDLSESVVAILVESQLPFLIQGDEVELTIPKYPHLKHMVAAGLNSFIGIPLIHTGTTIGALIFCSAGFEAYSDRDLAAAAAIGNHISGAFANNLLFAEGQRTTDALRRSEERNSAFARAIPDNMFRISRDGTYLDYSAPNPEFLFEPSREYVGRTIFDVAPSHVAPAVMKLIEEALETGQTKGLEYEFTLRGEQRWSEVRIVASGEDEAIVISRDITERIRIDKALKETEKESSRLAQVNGVLAEVGRIFSGSLYRESVWEDFSNAAKLLLNFDRFAVVTVDENNGLVHRLHVMGKSIPGRRTNDDYALKGSVVEMLVNSREPMSMSEEEFAEQALLYPQISTLLPEGLRSILGVPLISNDDVVGAIVFSSTNPNAYSDNDRETAMTIGAHISGAFANDQLYQEIQGLNISLERRVSDRTKELQDTMDELESFSYSVSHDLRGPLRSINGFSQAVMQKYGDRLDDEGRSYLERVRNATNHMGELIDDILDLSRIGRAELIQEPLDLGKMVLDKEAELKNAEPERQVEFVIANDATAFGDERLIGVLIDNLVRNAWKFTSKHSTARIELGKEQQNDETVYFVRDDGAGFSMEYADKLFLPFQRLHPTGEFEGTGIGLATVRRIVQRHGGRVWAEGEVEKGATIYFTLGSGTDRIHD